MKEQLERCLSIIFGLIFVGLSAVVSLETVLRKLFNISLQGADELGGYALAIGATLAFSVALIGRSHVRVDVFLVRFPKRVQTWLNWLSSVCMMGFAVLMSVLAYDALMDSHAYQSVSQTPWATPMVYPQSVWMVALAIFALLAAYQAIRATVLLIQGKYSAIDAMLAPKSTQDEVQEELEDLRTRSAGQVPPSASPAAAPVAAHSVQQPQGAQA